MFLKSRHQVMLGALTDHASYGNAMRERSAGRGRRAVLDGNAVHNNAVRERSAMLDGGAVRGRS